VRSSAKLVVSVAFAAWIGAASAQPASALPARSAVEAASVKVAQDPNLPGVEKKRQLQFKDLDSPKNTSKPFELPQWLLGFMAWIAEAGRVVVWLVGAAAVALLLVGLRHWVRVRAESRRPKVAPMPSHVRDLDIRPESLPPDIGRAAHAAWQRGDHRVALSLLYRGALSRLVNQHEVPIRAASTEGDCMALSRPRLAAASADYFERLVGAWQRAVYGGHMPDDATVSALCDAFDARLSRAGSVPMSGPTR
jgi:hypothetical protein